MVQNHLDHEDLAYTFLLIYLPKGPATLNICYITYSITVFKKPGLTYQAQMQMATHTSIS